MDSPVERWIRVAILSGSGAFPQPSTPIENDIEQRQNGANHLTSAVDRSIEHPICRRFMLII
ncbi:hypothetical protein ACMGT0_10080 [Pseudomonas sp. RHF3.3-3]|uniref:hypothetical protein n=1 Tax=unclassified Pseudomonas TaxID=196821 RepID=UPI003A8C3EED